MPVPNSTAGENKDESQGAAGVLRRTIHPEIRVLDSAKGLVEYVASDETLDSYKEIIRADGWRFTKFGRNAPFVDSHDYTSIKSLIGRVVDFRVVGRQLVETVQWAKDVAENALAQIGWKMTESGFLKAVSVGFWPIIIVRPGEKAWTETLKGVGQQPDADVRAVYTEQEQVELSAVIVGANPNAVARSYKAGALTDADLDTLSQQYAKRYEPGPAAQSPDAAAAAHRQATEAWLERFTAAIRRQ